MPELPEVEVTRLGISPYVEGKTISKIKVHKSKLRLPIDRKITKNLPGQKINTLSRCSRYLLLNTNAGTLLIHLGMTGHLKLLSKPAKPGNHDIFDIVFKDQKVLRYNDVRRFGMIIWTNTDPYKHKFLKDIGPDPLAAGFNGDYLFQKSRNRKISVKQLIMDSKAVAGIGNIYANESLFISRIDPLSPAGKLSKNKYDILTNTIKKVLSKAIKTGRAAMNFQLDKEWAGYFPQELMVYKREGKACRICKNSIERTVIGQRSTFFCRKCQKKTG
jgi:formamidopyrimidine-DNA glycosylase